MKIRDLPPNKSLTGTKFKIPKAHPECPMKRGTWYSQWGSPNGKAGVWVKKDIKDSQIYPLFLDKLEEALEFEVVE